MFWIITATLLEIQLTILTVFALMFTGLIAHLCWLVYNRNRRLPPGPLANWIPIVGYLPFLKWGQEESHDIMCRLAKKYGKIFHLQLGSTILIVIADYKLFRETFKRDDMSRRSLPPSMDVMDGLGIVHANGAMWKNQRYFVQTILRSLGIARSSINNKVEFEEKAMNAVTLFLDELSKKEGEPFDVEYFLSYTVLNIFYSTVMGTSFEPDDPNVMEQIRETHDSFRSRTILTTGNFIPILRLFPSFKKTIATVMESRETSRNFFRKIVAEKRLTLDPNVKTPDLIQAFLIQMDKDKEEGKSNSYFTELQLLSLIGDLTSAGLETTKTTMQWILLAILNKPVIQTKIQDELDTVIGQGNRPSLDHRSNLPYVEATILETLRFSSILPLGLNHNGFEDTEIDGYRIPRDANISGLIWKFHRDPQLWRNPDEFDPENHIGDDGSARRYDYLVPFSTGRRICIGEEIARKELFLLLTGLLHKFQILPVEGEKIPALNEAVTGVLRCPLPFKIRAVPRF